MPDEGIIYQAIGYSGAGCFYSLLLEMFRFGCIINYSFGQRLRERLTQIFFAGLKSFFLPSSSLQLLENERNPDPTEIGGNFAMVFNGTRI